MKIRLTINPVLSRNKLFKLNNLIKKKKNKNKQIEKQKR